LCSILCNRFTENHARAVINLIIVNLNMLMQSCYSRANLHISIGSVNRALPACAAPIYKLCRMISALWLQNLSIAAGFQKRLDDLDSYICTSSTPFLREQIIPELLKAVLRLLRVIYILLHTTKPLKDAPWPMSNFLH